MNTEHKARCAWIANGNLMIRYHDEEWSVPVHDDRKCFEFIVLDAFQAGLSWSTVLHKCEDFRKGARDGQVFLRAFPALPVMPTHDRTP
jgi:3-methyladenine DNA glycosylase Tag